MPQVEVPLVPLHELIPGQLADCFALLAEKNKGVTREGKPYYACRFRNRKRTASCLIWGDGVWYPPCEQEWQEGQCYKLRGVYGEHDRFGPQIELHGIRGVVADDSKDGFDLSQFVESSKFSVDEMLTSLLELVKKEIHDLPLQRLASSLLEKHAAALKELPASDRRFYPFRGGWLEHVLAVTKNCIYLADHYLERYVDLQPPLNRDLIVAGAVLHDIGRVLELKEDPTSPQPTVLGKLFGHLILGRDLVRDAARELGDVNPELVQLLEHIVLTHLTLPEWGSPRLPLIPEVLILHHADDMDAKMEMYARCLTKDQNPGPFTARDPILNKPLLKGRSV